MILISKYESEARANEVLKILGRKLNVGKLQAKDRREMLLKGCSMEQIDTSHFKKNFLYYGI